MNINAMQADDKFNTTLHESGINKHFPIDKSLLQGSFLSDTDNSESCHVNDPSWYTVLYSIICVADLSFVF